MKKETMIEMVKQMDVEANGKVVTIGMVFPEDLKDVPKKGKVSSFIRLSRKESQTILYMAQQLIKFTDTGNTIHLYLQPEMKYDSMLLKAIDVSSRSHLIKYTLVDTEELVEKRVLITTNDNNFTVASRDYMLRLWKNANNIVRVSNSSEYLKEIKKLDMVWHFVGRNKQDKIKVYNVRGKLKTIYVDCAELVTLIRTNNETAENGDYSHVSEILSTQHEKGKSIILKMVRYTEENKYIQTLKKKPKGEY